MKDDGYKSRHARAGLHLKTKKFNGSDDGRKMLETFVAQGLQGAKAIQAGELLNSSEFEHLYRSFCDISDDAAHVSVTSLNRHYIENLEDQSALLIIDPALDEIDMLVIVTELGISMIIATLLMKVNTKTELWDKFQELIHRYRELDKTSCEQIPNTRSGSSE